MGRAVAAIRGCMGAAIGWAKKLRLRPTWGVLVVSPLGGGPAGVAANWQGQVCGRANAAAEN